jgi:hypothetical protein
VFNKALGYEDVKGSGGIAPLFLTSAVDGGEGSVLRSSRFNGEEGFPGASWIGNWVGPEQVCTLLGTGKFLASTGNRAPAVYMG